MAPTVQTPAQQSNAKTQAVAPIPFTRAARRKSIQAHSQTYTLAAGSTTLVAPIELPAAGYLRDVEMLVTISSAGNAANVALPAGGDVPWNVINQLSVTNAAGDSIYVPIPGYQLYLINKWSGIYPQPQCDPRSDPAFTALSTGGGATAGSGSFMLRIPFERDPRDAFCALPNMAANKAYQVNLTLASISGMWAGGTAPNGAVTVTVTMIANYWGTPNATNGDGYPQEQAPAGNNSVSLWRYQVIPVVGGGNRINQLLNVGNVIPSIIVSAYNNANPPVRSDAVWPPNSFIRLNNDPLFVKPVQHWRSQMRQYSGYGGAGIANDVAGGLDTGVYVIGDFQAQHGHVRVDGPRDQWLVTNDATLLQLEGDNYGGAANYLTVLTNEVKPTSAQALYSLNIS